MSSRRAFLKSAAWLTTGTLFSSTGRAASAQYIGLQLYTVREAMGQDPSGTLARVAQLGYNTVEGATYTGTQTFYGLTPAAFATLLRQQGLIMPSNHYLLGQVQPKGQPVQGTILHGWNKAVDDAARIGLKYMVCAYLFDSERGDLDQYKRLAEQLNQAGECCHKAGLQLAYHNHDFEFVAQQGQLPYQVLLAGTDANLVKMELDLYWVTKAGYDPVTLFQQHPGRFPLWHVKDMARQAPHGFTEVGNGCIDFQRLFAQAKQAGLTHFFVEQDETPGSPFESIRQSIAHIKRLLQ
jgi:sugar phosphate isomerase/epimerase